MQWIVFGILAMIVVSGVRRMANEVKTTAAPFSQTPQQQKTATAWIADIQETVQCNVCNAYIVKNAAACGRDGCPFGISSGK
jgi:hypothetical protein